MSADTGGAAFPTQDINGANGEVVQFGSPGMTLLDYFAGQALAGMCVNDGDSNFDGWNADGIARHAYRIAAAMLTERARRTEK